MLLYGSYFPFYSILEKSPINVVDVTEQQRLCYYFYGGYYGP